MVKEGAIVIDVGINRVEGKLVGDVDFENVKDKFEGRPTEEKTHANLPKA